MAKPQVKPKLAYRRVLVKMSGEALAATRRLIGSRFGDRYLPEKPRAFRNRAKNAQEAHEAIRPTDLFRRPDEIGRFLDDDQRRLYELIWKRTVASQMAAALLDRVTVDIADAARKVGLRATGQTVAFDGFLKLYQEGRDDEPPGLLLGLLLARQVVLAPWAALGIGIHQRAAVGAWVRVGSLVIIGIRKLIVLQLDFVVIPHGRALSQSARARAV